VLRTAKKNEITPDAIPQSARLFVDFLKKLWAPYGNNNNDNGCVRLIEIKQKHNTVILDEKEAVEMRAPWLSDSAGNCHLECCEQQKQNETPPRSALKGVL